MKTIAQLKKQKPVFLNNWSDRIGLISDFNDLYMSAEEYNADEAPYQNVEFWEEKKKKMAVAIDEFKQYNILFASYGQDNYSGDAFVLFEQDGKLYEVHGGHCSCYGLEGQWTPEETALESLKLRLNEGQLGKDDYSGNEFATELREFLGL